jgi:hypothetical protein
MTATDAQVEILMREREKGRTQQQAAAKANLRDRKTVAKYEALGKLPSQLKEPRTYRTRPDAFSEDWPEVEEMLRQAPELEAKALLEWLCEQYPERYQSNQLRTFQRRVQVWRGLNVPQTVILPQIRQAGQMLQLDGTWLTELGVTIAGQPLKHLLIHCVLPYSNWEWGRIAQSESLAAVQLGLQSSLVKLGHVPEWVQTDNSSAATRRLGIAEEGAATTFEEKRGYTLGYLQLLEHYRLKPAATHTDSPNENGDIEAANGALKRSLGQHLLLRGSRNFENLETYERFLFTVMDKRNALRRDRLAEEAAVMRPLTATPLATNSMHKVRVSNSGLIRVQRKSYSVPTSLIGRQVTVQAREWTLAVYYGGQLVETLPRLVGAKTYRVNYRHVIDSLLRKPGGFRDYRYREDLFPTLVFRRAWERLNEWLSPRRADIVYLRILNLAAKTMESEVACALELLLESGHSWDDNDVAQLVQPETPAMPQVAQETVSLQLYDQLLGQRKGHVYA